MSETMTTKHEIEIPDLPEGWQAVAFREPRLGEHYLSDINTVIRSNFNNCGESNLIVEKIKPRRTILEETSEHNTVDGNMNYTVQSFKNDIWLYNQPKIWRVVKEE